MTEPRLPGDAPRALRDFVACRTMRVELDLADLGWIPKPEGVSDALAPSVTIEDGATATNATIKIGYMGGYVSVELPVSIVDGQLRVDTTDVGLGIGPNITKWVDAFNRQLAENGKQLDEFEVNGNRVAITKRAAAAPADTSSIASSTSATAVTPSGPGESAEPAEEKPRTGCLAWIGGAIAAIAVAIGIGVAVTNDGDDGDDERVVITDDASPATTAAPATTTTPAATTTEPPPAPTTTVTEVGLADDEDSDDAVVAPGSSRCGDSTALLAYGELELPDGGCEYGGATNTYAVTCGASLPCSSLGTPPFVAAGNGGWSHQIQEPDSETGETGASTWEELLEYARQLTADVSELRVSAVCSGQQVNGASAPATDGPTLIQGPLFQYGLCSDRFAILTTTDGDDALFPLADTYTVDASEPDPIPPATNYTVSVTDLSQFAEPFFSDVNTTNNVIGGREVGDDCLWFFEPQNVAQVVRVLDGCSVSDHFWVFAAGTTDVEVELSVTDTVVGTTSTYANPLGDSFAPISDTSAFATSGPLFDRSVFPCGYGHVAYTACPVGEPAMQAGGFVTVSAAMGGNIPIAGDGTARAHHVDFGPAGGSRYSITQDADGWTVTSSAESTRARALVRGNAITLVVPHDELPEGSLASVWSTEVDGVVHDQPVVPVVGVIRTPEILAPAEPAAEDEPPAVDEPPADDDTDAGDDTDAAAPPEATETLADFYSQLSASVAAGDASFSLDRLDPRVFEVYPDSCPAALSSFADPDLSIEFVEEVGFEPWTYEANGQAIEIPDALTVIVRLTGRSQDGVASEAHVTIIDGEYRWFTFC